MESHPGERPGLRAPHVIRNSFAILSRTGCNNNGVSGDATWLASGTPPLACDLPHHHGFRSRTCVHKHAAMPFLLLSVRSANTMNCVAYSATTQNNSQPTKVYLSCATSQLRLALTSTPHE
jgi:hypothetical protein